MNPELLKSVIRKARKRHICSLCGGYIEPGVEYERNTCVYDGTVYDWLMHRECSAVSTFLWDYADPDDGMTDDDFQDACQDVCRTFVCPDCEHFDSDGSESGDYCVVDGVYCIHKLFELSKKYYLSAIRNKQHGWIEWKLLPNKEAADGKTDV